MNDKVETQGKTVKDAVAEALLRLGARREEVIVKVVEEPKSGFLGLLGGRPAKVLVEKKRGDRSRGGNRRRRTPGGHSLSDDKGARGAREGQNARGDSRRGRRPAARSEDDRQQGRGRRPRRASENEEQRQDGRREERRDSGRNGGRDGGRRDNQGQSKSRNRRPRAAAKAEPGTMEQDKNVRTEGERPSGRNRRGSRGRNRRPREQAAEQPRETTTRASANENRPRDTARTEPRRSEPRRPAPTRETVSPVNTNEQETSGMERRPEGTSAVGTVIREGIPGSAHAKAIRNVAPDDLKETLEKLAGGMLLRAGFPNRCTVVDGEYLQVRVVTDDASAGMLIGRHGATVDSVEHLVERMISTVNGDRVKMNLDINNYRRRRQDTLADRVYDAVNKVKETGQEFHMEPMNARERRLVHLQVAETEGLSTVTVIADGAKHVVITRSDGTETPDAAADVAAAEAPATVESAEGSEAEARES